MMNDRLKRNIKMLDEVIANEMEVKYVEFGNEYFFGQSRAGDGTNGGAIVEPYSAGAANTSLAGAFPGNGKTYADAVNQWADTLIKRYPGIRLSAIAADANSTSPSRRNSWNTEVVQFIDKDLVPAVSVHLYGGVEDGNLITTEENLGKAFISWKTHWEWKKKYSSFPAAREFWLTEYNSNQDKKTWGHGLLNLFIIHTLLSEVQLGLTNYHQFAQNTTNGSEIYASTRVLAMLARATRGKNSARQIKLNKELYLEGTDNKLPSVIAWSFSEKGNDESSYFLANFSAKEIELDITNIADSDGKFYYYSSSSLNNQNDQGIKFASINKNINLKPYSCYWFDAGGFLSVSSRKVEKQNQSDLKIFPNPGSDRISLIIDNKLSGANINLEIYAGSGVLKDEFHGNIKEIETEINKKINDWKPGLYILSFRTKDFTRTIKWVKK
jgi:hypothetical protein